MIESLAPVSNKRLESPEAQGLRLAALSASLDCSRVSLSCKSEHGQSCPGTSGERTGPNQLLQIFDYYILYPLIQCSSLFIASCADSPQI